MHRFIFIFIIAMTCVASYPSYGNPFFENCLRILGFKLSPPDPKNPVGTGFGILEKELQQDAREGSLIYVKGDWTYLDNPTRTPLERALQNTPKGRRIDLEYLDAEPIAGKETLVLFVLLENGQIVLGQSASPLIYASYEGRPRNLPHPTLASKEGKIARVLSAGQIFIKDGQIYRVDNQSGHYHPSKESLKEVEKALAKYPDLFHSNFEGYQAVEW